MEELKKVWASMSSERPRQDSQASENHDPEDPEDPEQDRSAFASNSPDSESANRRNTFKYPKEHNDAKVMGHLLCRSPFFWAFIIIFLVVLLIKSLSKIAATETGLKYNTITAYLDDTSLTQGLHTIPPFGTVIRWPITYQSVEYTRDSAIECNSRDGIRIVLDLTFQFRVDPLDVYDLTVKFESFDVYYPIIEMVARSSARHVCGDFTADQFQTQRANVSVALEEHLFTPIRDVYQADVADLQLRNIARPNDYELAVEEKESARSDIDLAINERKGELTKAYAELEAKRQEAATLLDKARTEANITLAFAGTQAESIAEFYDTLGTVLNDFKTSLELASGVEALKYYSNELVASNGAQIFMDSL